MDVAEEFEDKTILITGGTGSFGRHCARRLLQEDRCRKIIIFSRDEWKQWEMRSSDPIFNHPKIRYFLGDVRDLKRLLRAFQGVDYVIHAAALKQVPAAEYNPTEFVRTNVDGAINVIDAAIDAKVKKIIALSTDKAVNPLNLYGATKLCSDKLFISGNAYVGLRGFPIFSVVRYGNVMNSRGSIIPLWQQMIKDKASTLPVTDERMTRFWITLDDAVNYVLRAFAVMRGWEIFVPKIPSMHIVDMVQALAPGIPYSITGIRPGEKLHEIMITKEHSRHTLEFDDYYVILPEYSLTDQGLFDKITKDRPVKFVEKDFSYSSDTNTKWLSKEEFLAAL